MSIAISMARTALEVLLGAPSCAREPEWLPSHDAARLGRVRNPPPAFGAGSFARA
jgi:hypothetical protein